jgi:hypothetical protein
MTRRPITYGTLDQLPRVSQDLRLLCRQCGTPGVYDVGAIFADLADEGAEKYSGFANYFRCRKCGSAGPWEIDDSAKMLDLLLRAKMDPGFEGFRAGRFHMFDGTFIQTPAMGEEHLLKFIKAAPQNAFLHTRLGNLFRACGHQTRAADWYGKALALDPGDVEARYHLFCFAVEAEDVPAMLVHAPRLVCTLLEGRTTDKDDLTEGLALSVVDHLRTAPGPFRQHFLGGEPDRSERPESLFIRTLLAQEGDEEIIQRDAAERLLRGEPAPTTATSDPAAPDDPEMPAVDLAPSLREAVRVAALNPEKLSVAFEADGRNHIRILDKHTVQVADGRKAAAWAVPSLRELFRGDRPPPPDMDQYPPEYTPHFFFIENQVLTLCYAMGDRTDQEMEEIYTAIRRRPDGRSLSVTHDLLWQVAALLLGCYPLSEGEFTALFDALAHSTRRWALRPVSRFYAGYLREAFGEDHSSRRLPR